MKKQAGGRTMQYTVRDVPAQVDAALRRKAAERGTSLTQVLREALLHAAGLGADDEPAHHDVDHLAGRWDEDPGFDAAVAAQDHVDDEQWR